MDNGFYFAREKDKGEIFTVYSSSTKDKILTDKVNDSREIEVICQVPDKLVESALKGKINLLNMSKLFERMHE